MNGIGRAELGAELGQGSDGMESGKNRADDSRSRTRGVGQTKSRPSILFCLYFYYACIFVEIKPKT